MVEEVKELKRNWCIKWTHFKKRLAAPYSGVHGTQKYVSVFFFMGFVNEEFRSCTF